MSDLTLLTYWQSQVWFDSATVYREVLDPVTGDSLGYRLVIGPLAGQYFRTPNYDTHSSDAGQSKEDNIFTSNKFKTQYGVDIQSTDLMLVTPRAGSSDWMSVKGAPKNRAILGYCEVYLIPPGCPPGGPVII